MVAGKRERHAQIPKRGAGGISREKICSFVDTTNYSRQRSSGVTRPAPRKIMSSRISIIKRKNAAVIDSLRRTVYNNNRRRFSSSRRRRPLLKRCRTENGPNILSVLQKKQTVNGIARALQSERATTTTATNARVFIIDVRSGKSYSVDNVTITFARVQM